MAATINKQEIIAKYGRTPNDTGSPEVQIALLTARISLLTQLHFFCAADKKRLSQLAL